MSKISTYPSADNPLLLSDRLIGTEAIRPTPSSTPLATKNFSLGELLNLFSSEFPAASLQAVLNTGNSATQDINLTGEITATVIKPSNIEDTSGSQGTTFQFLSKGATSINWVDLPTYNLQSILDAGNTANQNIVLNGNITSTLIIPENIQDGLSSLGVVGQVLTKTSTGIEWSNISIPTTAGLADVLSVGNTANNTITVNSFIKNGGTSEQILIADGSTQPLVLRELNEGNGIGYTISPSRAYYGNIGSRAVDFSRSSVLDSVNGATGAYSFASGLNVIASGYLSKSFGYLIDNGGSGSFDTGYNLKDRGWTNFLTGTGHDVTGTNVTIVGQAADVVVNSLLSYNVGTDIVFAVGNGTIADANPAYTVTSRSTAFFIRKNGQAEFKYDVTANSFKKIGGLSTEYLMADGSVTTGAGDSFVPYTGATGNVDLGEWELKAGQISLDLSPTGTASVGTTRWNNSAGVSETTLKGGSVVLKNGVDLVARVVNKVTPNTTLTKSNYNAVKISGAQGQRLAVAYAQADNDYNSADTIGLVCETIATNQEGFIITVGQLEEINTSGSLQGESWSDGDVLYLSPTVPGAITNIKPTAVVGHLVVIGYVEYAHAVHGKIYVKIMNGWELDELHNVYINPTTLSNNDGLFYESSSMLWKNKTITDVLGYTPISGTGTTNYLSKFTGTGSLGNSLIYDDGASVLIGTTVNDTLNKLQVNGGISIKELSSFNANIAKFGLTINPASISTDGTAITYYYGINNVLTLLNSGIGFNGQYAYSSANLVNIGGQTAGSKVVAYGTVSAARRIDATDVSAHVNNELRAANNTVLHGQNISDTAYTKLAYSTSNAITNHAGIISEAFGTSTTLNVGTLGSKIATVGTYYGLDLRANVGNATSTATVTNYYALYHPAIVLAGTGSVTNRWGLYLSDPLMKNHIVGTTLIGTAVDNGVDKLQVNGTIAAGPATLSNQVVVKSQLDLKQNTLTNPLTGVGSNLDPTTYALQDGTTLYHSVKWFTPTSTVSTSGTTVTSVGTQFTSAMVGAKLIINGEWRIITAFTNTTNVIVASAYSQNYSGVIAGSWGIYSRCLLITNTGNVNYYSYQGAVMFTYISSDQFNVRFLGFSINDNSTAIQSAGALLKDSARIFWSNNSTYYGTKDLGLRRNSAGVLEIYDGITATGLEANRRDLLVRNVFGSKVLIGTTVDNGVDKLQVAGSIKSTSSVQVGDNILTADATNAGAIRYRSDANNSYMDMVMQTGASTYTWVNIKTNTW